MQNLVEIVHKATWHVLRSPRRLKDVKLLVLPPRKVIPREGKFAFEILKTFFCSGSPITPLLHSGRHWLYTLLLIRCSEVGANHPARHVVFPVVLGEAKA